MFASQQTQACPVEPGFLVSEARGLQMLPADGKPPYPVRSTRTSVPRWPLVRRDVIRRSWHGVAATSDPQPQGNSHVPLQGPMRHIMTRQAGCGLTGAVQACTGLHLTATVHDSCRRCCNMVLSACGNESSAAGWRRGIQCHRVSTMA